MCSIYSMQNNKVDVFTYRIRIFSKNLILAMIYKNILVYNEISKTECCKQFFKHNTKG
jgi:hypothetical protein